jgi:hypothetical protein
VNKLALDWVDIAIRAEEENKVLRGLMTGLIIQIASNRELLADARRELVERFPEEGSA